MPARVLVVAARPQIHEQLVTILRRDGHEILTASTGQEGLRRWNSERPDLIAVDDELPDLHGLDVVSRLRRGEPVGVHTPVVLLGNGSDVQAKVRALRAGA